jgi:outer membrane receptor for ferrienterochelin and colicin
MISPIIPSKKSVSKEAIKMLEFTNRKNKNAAPEYAVWVKSRDELMNDPVLVVGQKSDMEKAFGNKINSSILIASFDTKAMLLFGLGY